MITISDKANCSGCSACYAICPKHCITMRPDKEGYLYPSVDVNLCINCGACDKVCPFKKPFTVNSDNTLAFAVQNKDEIIRMQSASGGAFSAFATVVLNKGGIVFGGCFDKDFNVCHDGVSTIDDLKRLRCSKYVQSDMGNTFSKVKTLLKEDRLVLFSGTPCQVEGLNSYLRRKYDNLITLDLVCHGTPSPGLWKKYLAWNSIQEKSPITYVSFRDKHFGYAGSTMAIGFENGKTKYQNRAIQFFKYTFFQDLNSRPSCFKCHFKTIQRNADITLYDCWHVNAFDKSMDDDRGTTMVLLHSDKGQKLFEEAQPSIRFCKADVNKAIDLDGIMAIKSTTPNPKREQFFNDVNTLPFEQLIEKYFPLSLKKRIVQWLKPLLYKTGILSHIKRALKS